MKDPVALGLEIERPADPWDRAARLQGVTVGNDGWKELHVTFKVEKPFAEGWFAYVSCLQPNAEFRLDLVPPVRRAITCRPSWPAQAAA